VFDRAYAASFPTVPNRCDVMTGRFTFTEFDWAPLPRNQTVLSQVLGAAGYTTMMIADTPHILQAGYHFDRGFSGWEWIRGQENDRWKTSPPDPPLPCAPEKLRSPFTTVKQHLRNTAGRRGEEDCFVARTMAAAGRWLEENRACDKFFLYVDTFDPHEPWDPPQHYVDLYDPGYRGERVFYPIYGDADYLTKRELKHMRALYAGEVTLVDAWVGRLLRRVDELGLTDNTAIIFTTDHGFYHGEHNLTGKSRIWEGGHATVPLYEEVAHIPLLIRLPGQQKARRVSAYAQPPDLMPTILDLCGVKEPGTMNGGSLVPILSGKRRSIRNFAVTTPSLAHDPNVGRQTTITAGDWSLIYSGNPGGPVAEHPTAIVDSVVRPARVGPGGVEKPALYNLKQDPGQKRNILARNRAAARKLHRMFIRFCEQLEMSDDFLQHRREL